MRLVHTEIIIIAGRTNGLQTQVTQISFIVENVSIKINTVCLTLKMFLLKY